MLDYEAGQFYLFNMIVTVWNSLLFNRIQKLKNGFYVYVQDRGGLMGSTQVALNVIDEKDQAPVWKLEVPFISIIEELPVVSASNNHF